MNATKNCPNCNATIDLFFEDSSFASCSNCSSIVSLKAARQEKAVLGKNTRKNYPARRYIKLGQKFIFQDVGYRITGRAVIRVEYKLPLANENNAGGFANYHEWFCRSESNDYLTITENSVGFTISRPEPIEDRIDQLLKARSMRMNTSMDFRAIEEEGKGKVLYFEGEADDNYYPGRKLCYATYKSGGYTYGAEWNPDKKQASISFFVQNTMLEMQMHKMIRESNDLSEYNQKLKEYNFFRGSVLITTFALLFMLFLSAGYRGKTIYSYSTNIKEIPESGIKAPPFTIESLNEAYSVKLKTNLAARNTEILAAAEINNNNGNPIYLVEKWFWKAAGGSGSDKWSEKEIDITNYLKPQKAGEYTPVIFVEKTKLSRLTSSDSLTISVSKGIFLTRYFVTLFIIFIVLIILIYTPVSGHFVKTWYFQLLDK